MKLFRSKYLLIGVLAGLLAGGGWFAWAAIQSEVGLNIYDVATGSWRRSANLIGINTDNIVLTGSPGTSLQDTQSLNYFFNGTGWDQGRTVGIGDAVTQTGIQAINGFVFNGTTYDRSRSVGIGDAASTGIPASGLFAFNGTAFDRVRTATTGTAANGTGILGIAPYLRDSTNLFASQATSSGILSDGNTGNRTASTSLLTFNGSTYDRFRSIAAAPLTDVTSSGTILTVPLTTWTVSSGPAAGSQATASKAAGGGTVRHVATTISACYSDTATAVARHVNLRDGASGAGTILARWMLGVPAANDSHCVTLSGFSIIGTANTAMTLEFDAAGAATGEQTVNLTGYSVP